MVNIYQIFGKVLFNYNDPLPVLPGNDQDLDHENIVNTYLSCQVCKVNDIVCFRDQYSNAEKPWYLSFRHFCLKLVSWMVTISLPNLCQIFHKTLIETPVLGKNVEAKVSWFLCIGTLVSKRDNVMHFAHLVKQVSVDCTLWPRSCSMPGKTCKGSFMVK